MPGTIDLCLKQQHSPSEKHMNKYTKNYRETVTKALKHLGHPYGNPPTKLVIEMLRPFVVGKLPRAKSDQREALLCAALSVLSTPQKAEITKPSNKKKTVKSNLVGKEFYKSWVWKEARFAALKRFGRSCLCCGWTPSAGGDNHLVVDHIKPIRTHPHLALDPNNHQVLCNDCNMGKSFRHTDDFR